MTHDRRTLAVAKVLLISGVIPVGTSTLISLLFRGEWHHPQEHLVIEAFGAVAALSVAGLVSFLRRYRRDEHHLLLVATALIWMGILDGLHAAASEGVSFVWIHSTAVFVGGLLFALVWIPAPSGELPSARALPQWVAAVALLFGLLSLAYPSFLPPMATDGEFTLTAELLNILGGVFFLLAAYCGSSCVTFRGEVLTSCFGPASAFFSARRAFFSRSQSCGMPHGGSGISFVWWVTSSSFVTPSSLC
jgi:hypothetical protein